MDAAREIMQEIVDMTWNINTTTLGSSGGGPDIGDWTNAGVPSANLINANQHYFIFHHSEGEHVIRMIM